MSLTEKKAFEITFKIYVYCTYIQSSRYMGRIYKFIEKIISAKKLVRMSCSFTDKLIR